MINELHCIVLHCITLNYAITGITVSSEGKQARDLSFLKLALDTLGSFTFNSPHLLSFARDSVLCYLDHDDPEVRRQAALACTRLLLRHRSFTGPKHSMYSYNHSHAHHSHNHNHAHNYNYNQYNGGNQGGGGEWPLFPSFPPPSSFSLSHTHPHSHLSNFSHNDSNYNHMHNHNQTPFSSSPNYDLYPHAHNQHDAHLPRYQQSRPFLPSYRHHPHHRRRFQGGHSNSIIVYERDRGGTPKLSTAEEDLICQVLERLLTVGIADPDPNIRYVFIHSIHFNSFQLNSIRFD
jgi:hypothetical protein